MKSKKEILVILIISLFLVLIVAGDEIVFAQGQSINIGVGSLSYNLDDTIVGEDSLLQFPREFDVYTSQNCVRGEGFLIAAKNFRTRAYYIDGYPNAQRPGKGWVKSDTFVTFDSFVIDGTPTIMLDPVHIIVPVHGAFKKYWKYEPPLRLVNDEDLSTSDWRASYEEVDGTIATEQMGIAQCRTSMGITVTEKVYLFGNPGFDDFAIVEYVFKYTGETPNVDKNGNPIVYSDPIQDCYLGIKYFPIIGDDKVVPNSGGWQENTDDWVDYTYGEDIDGDGQMDTLRVMYGWDGNAGVTTEDDEGDPLISSSGIFLSTQYPGVAVLHVDRAPNDPTNDKFQPHLSYVSWGAISSRNSLTSGPQGPGIAEVYNILTAGGELTPPLDWGLWNSTGTENWLRPLSQPSDPTDAFSQIGTMAFGPYQFNNVGDSIRIVLCHTVGSISWEKAIELGAQWKTGSITSLDKNKILRSGRDSLFAKIESVKELFVTPEGNYDFDIKTISEKISPPPPWPGMVKISSVVAGCKVEWSEVGEAVAYRVYRRLQPTFYIEQPGTETYPLVFQTGGENPGDEIEYDPALTTSWTDENVVPAQYYWYYVTAINVAGVESSHFVSRSNPTAGDLTRGGVTPYEKPPENISSIQVVPNPYHIKSVRLYNRTLDLLDFVGLPAGCRIRIFTQSGDLISTIDHELQVPPSSAESWEMRTSTNQTIASGLYVYVVDECKNHENRSINQTKVGKFVVIR